MSECGKEDAREAGDSVEASEVPASLRALERDERKIVKGWLFWGEREERLLVWN